MPTPKWFLLGVLLPAAIAAGVVLLAALTRKRHPDSRVTDVGSALGIGGAFIVGFWAASDWPSVPPRQANEWLAVVLLPAAFVVACLGTLPRRGTRSAWAGRVLLGTAIVPLLARPVIENEWSAQQALVYMDGAILLLLGGWLAMAHLARKQPSTALPLVMMLTGGAIGVTLMMSGTNVLGQYALSTAGALGAVAIVGLCWRSRHGAAGAVDVAAVVLAALLTGGMLYADLPLWNALLLSGAPLLAWIGMMPGVRDWRPWARVLIQCIAVAIPLAFAVYRAQVVFAAEMKASGYY